MGGGTSGGLFDGRLAPAKVFEYQGATYALWAAQYKTSATVKIAQKVGETWKLVDELTDQDFLNRVTPGSPGNKTAKQNINDLITAAKALSNAAKAQPQPGAANPLPALQAKQAEVVVAEERVYQDILFHACKSLQAGCFAAGTKLLTRTGWRAVEEIRPGEEVLSRDESDVFGEPQWKPVEEVFRRTGYVLHLHVGGALIRTTPEHPFYERERGWVRANEPHVGDFTHTRREPIGETNSVQHSDHSRCGVRVEPVGKDPRLTVAPGGHRCRHGNVHLLAGEVDLQRRDRQLPHQCQRLDRCEVSPVRRVQTPTSRGVR